MMMGGETKVSPPFFYLRPKVKNFICPEGKHLLTAKK
jgi:hypothetical protein